MADIHFPTPSIEGPLIPVYSPKPDVYHSRSTERLTQGETYERWKPNDFTIIKDDRGVYHLIGITHPCPDDFIDAYHYNPETLHQSSWQLFHATASAERFSDLLYADSFEQQAQILPSTERPGESEEIWAPYVIRKGQEYLLYYTPNAFRYASSPDLYQWTPRGELFRDGPMARDVQIFVDDDGLAYLTYLDENTVYTRTSRDLIHWSDRRVLQQNPFLGGMSESPFLFKRKGVYYLLWCLCDGRNGSYDTRSFLFAGHTLEELARTAPITMLKIHAPEVWEENGAYYILGTFFPKNGVNAARLRFDDE